MTDRDDYKRLADEASRWAKSNFINAPDARDFAIRAESALRAASVKAGEVVAGEPVAHQWCVYEETWQKTGWEFDGNGDRAGWEALAKRMPTTYRIVTRPLYATPTASVGAMREALTDVATVSACVAVVESPTLHVKMLANINAIATGALKALAAANQSDGGVEESK
jgi:hypothetical protein